MSLLQCSRFENDLAPEDRQLSTLPSLKDQEVCVQLLLFLRLVDFIGVWCY